MAIGLCGVLALAAWTPAPRPTPALAHGASLGLFASTPDYDYGPLIKEIRARGLSDLMVVVPWYQADIGTPEVVWDAVRSPSRKTLTRTLRQARTAGLRVAVMPVVRVPAVDGAWRGQIDAVPDAWFLSYQPLVLELAELAEGHATRLVVGSELSRMTRHEAHWRALTTQVRGTFSGELTYSANWDAYARVPFWDAMDAVGVTGYFPLSEAAAPTRVALEAAWRAPLKAVRDFAERAERPLIFTEIGYPDHQRAAARPWDRHADPRPAPRLQATLLSVACDQLAGRHGLYIWNWFGHGGRQDRGYSPRGKPAAMVIERCMRSDS